MTQISILFEKAIEKLEAQGVRSYDAEKDMCKYRDGKGNCCLFGHMISDEHYNEDLEGFTARNPKVLLAIEQTTGVDLMATFTAPYELVRLQEVHDHHWKEGDDFKKYIPYDLQLKIWGE